MADKVVNYSHTDNSEDAYTKAKAEVTPEYVAKYNVKADVNFDDSKKEIKAIGKGFEMTLSFGEASCEVSLSLSLILRALKGKILEAVERKLQKTI